MLHVLLKLSMGVQYTRFTTFVIVAETEARSRFVVCGASHVQKETTVG